MSQAEPQTNSLQGFITRWYQSGTSGTARVVSRIGTAHIRLDGGRVVAAQLGALEGQVALNRLLNLADKTLRVELVETSEPSRVHGTSLPPTPVFNVAEGQSGLAESLRHSAVFSRSELPAGADPSRLAAGTTVGDYEVISSVGSDLTGVSYLVRRRAPGGFEKLFSLKLLHRGPAVQSVLDGARIMARLNHPNVVQVLEVGKRGENPFIVTPHVRGCTLAQLLPHGDVPQRARAVVSVLLDVLEGVMASEAASREVGGPPLTHRNFVPSAFLLGLDGVCRLAALGGPSDSDDDSSLKASSLSSAWHYLAPEVSTAGAPAIESGPRALVFSFGVLMWTCLTGGQLNRTQNQRDGVIPPSVESGTPACLDHVCLRALQPHPRARYASLSELALEMRRVATQHDLLGSHNETAAWVKSVVGSGANFTGYQAAPKAGPAESSTLRVEDVLPLPIETNPGAPTTVAPSRTVQVLQWLIVGVVVALLALVALSPELLNAVFR